MAEENKIIIIEIKAFCSDPDKIELILKELNADFIGIDHQIDTYFNVNYGRLKLREGNIENALIHYDREDKSGPKKSKVLIYKSNPDSELKEILVHSLGILTVVNKKRKIYFIDNIKFHIDEVSNLGTFVEIEAIDTNRSLGEEQLNKQCQKFLQLFGIKENDLIPVSYSDMLIEEENRNKIK